MACDPQALVDSVPCQFPCLSGTTLAAIRIRLLCAIIDGEKMACDAQTLINAAQCIEQCVPVGMLAAVEISLLCQIANAGISGGSGAASCLLCGTVPPVAAPACACALYYNTTAGAFYYWDSTNVIWVLLVGGP